MNRIRALTLAFVLLVPSAAFSFSSANIQTQLKPPRGFQAPQTVVVMASGPETKMVSEKLAATLQKKSATRFIPIGQVVDLRYRLSDKELNAAMKQAGAQACLFLLHQSSDVKTTGYTTTVSSYGSTVNLYSTPQQTRTLGYLIGMMDLRTNKAVWGSSAATAGAGLSSDKNMIGKLGGELAKTLQYYGLVLPK